MNPFRSVVTVIGCVVPILACGEALWAQVTWNIDSTINIGGNAVTTVVGSPTVVSTPFGNALRFDGNDGIIVNADPVAGAATFTVEMLFRPDPLAPLSINVEPRVLYIQSISPNTHRAALEARIEANNQQWHIDTFLQSQTAGQPSPSVVTPLTLEEENKLHPLGQWYNYAMTYDGSQLRAYLNGQLESSGALTVQAMAPGQTSIGMRITQTRFFEGIVAKVRFTPSVVDPADFMLSYVPGDYDRNGDINVADYGKWKTDYGATVTNPGDGADGNRDGVVDAGDYVFWRNRLESLTGGGSSGRSAPEPSAGILCAPCLAVLSMPRTRRHRRSA